MDRKTNILIIEDDKKIQNFLAMALRAKGYSVTRAGTGNA